MTDALQNAPILTTISQLEAIANLRDLFEKGRLIGPSVSASASPVPHGRPPLPTHEPPRVLPPATPLASTWTSRPPAASSHHTPAPVSQEP